MTESCWSAVQAELTAAAVFPILLGLALVLVSLVAATRAVRVADQPDVPAASLAILGALGVTAALVGGLVRPGSLAAFAVGAVGASLCYAAVSPGLLAEGQSPVAAGSVALLSVLWIAGFLTVGATAGVGSRHYALGGVLGTLWAGVAVLGSWRDDRRLRHQYGWLALSAAVLFPAAVGTLFGEELLFVAYLIAAVVTTVLWWFSRLRAT